MTDHSFIIIREGVTESIIDPNEESLFEKIENRVAAKYKMFQLHGKRAYALPDGEIIRVCHFISFKAYVIEYAENMEEAEKEWFEDGKVFYPEDYIDEEMLIEDIIKEIESGIKEENVK